VHWADDSLALAKGNARAVVESGGKSWFFITSDYAFGRKIEQDASEVVTAAGGTVLGQSDTRSATRISPRSWWRRRIPRRR